MSDKDRALSALRCAWDNHQWFYPFRFPENDQNIDVDWPFAREQEYAIEVYVPLRNLEYWARLFEMNVSLIHANPSDWTSVLMFDRTYETVSDLYGEEKVVGVMNSSEFSELWWLVWGREIEAGKKIAYASSAGNTQLTKRDLDTGDLRKLIMHPRFF
jgi:hypothetical protein